MASQGLPSPCLRVLSLAVSLWALCQLEEQAGDFMEDGYLNSAQLAAARSQVEHLEKEWEAKDSCVVHKYSSEQWTSETTVLLFSAQIKALLKDVRPEAAALVDSFNLPDYFLNSCIGRSDGKIYQAVLDAAKREPFNKTEEGPGYRPYLAKYLRQAKL